MDDVQEWLRSKGLGLAEQKTEIMMLNNKSIDPDFAFRIGSTEIKPAPTLKYRGVTFDTRRNFKAHVERVTNKAVKTMAALSRLMTNMMPAKQRFRRLYYYTMEAIVLYGAPIWANTAYTHANSTLLRSTQRIGLSRVLAAYRTVPVDTLCVLSGIPPWEFKLEERRDLFHWEKAYLGGEPRPRRRTTRTYTEGTYNEETIDQIGGIRSSQDHHRPPPDTGN